MSRSLIIVESPAKAKTLQRYLGKKFDVRASVGHVRDLPVKELGVDVEHDFAPKYVTIRGKAKVLTELKQAAKTADAVYLAPDPDREGEAIAWHIAQALGRLDKPIHRALFHELTKQAIEKALANATEINQHLFEAQQARRILDRLVGYKLSPLLWEKVRRGLSAGRVQSVAVRMICEREEEIRRFVPEEYWTMAVTLEGPKPPPLVTSLERIDGKKARIPDEATANAIRDELQAAAFTVAAVDKKEKKRHAPPPFITSTMQMDANRKLRFSAKKTMSLAQRLYEGVPLGKEGPTGLITYMRTDSTRISDEAVAAARQYITATFGKEYCPPRPNRYKTGKGAQDAHEAIRPTDVNRTPEAMAPFLDKDLLALYTLIWKRFVACQMAPARYDQTTILVDAGRYRLKATGSILRFPGFLTLYQEATDGQAQEEGDRQLPDLAKGDPLTLAAIEPKQHFTKPPPRYTEASLVKALEENGVGRPSTYASILSTIVDKEYVRLEDRVFHPTELGTLINDLLVNHFPKVIDVEFTAAMEEQLDQVADGRKPWQEVLRQFYGPFHATLEEARQKMQSVKRQVIPTDHTCDKCGGRLVIRWGRNGEFLACENFPQCKNTMDFQRQEDGTIVPAPRPEPEESGEVCEKCGKPMVYRHGRYGRFLACSGYPACKNVRAESTGVACPEEGCDGEITRRISKRGKVFYGCNRFPACRFVLWDKPVPRPCPACNNPYMVEKTTKALGEHLYCPKCRHREKP